MELETTLNLLQKSKDFLTDNRKFYYYSDEVLFNAEDDELYVHLELTEFPDSPKIDILNGWKFRLTVDEEDYDITEGDAVKILSTEEADMWTLINRVRCQIDPNGILPVELKYIIGKYDIKADIIHRDKAPFMSRDLHGLGADYNVITFEARNKIHIVDYDFKDESYEIYTEEHGLFGAYPTFIDVINEITTLQKVPESNESEIGTGANQVLAKNQSRI